MSIYTHDCMVILFFVCMYVFIKALIENRNGIQPTTVNLLLTIRLLNLTKSGLPSTNSGKNNNQFILLYCIFILSQCLQILQSKVLLTFSKINSLTKIYYNRYDVHLQL